MKKMIRILSVLLTVAMLLCSVAFAAATPADNHIKYDEPVTIKVIGSISDQVRKNTLRDEYTIENNPWTDAYRDVLNVNREYMWVSSGDDYTMKRNLALSSGDIPDFLNVNLIELQQLVEAGVIVDNVRELYEAEATDRLKEYVGLYGDVAWSFGEFDGGSYGIPVNGGVQNDQRGFVWIRKDWLDNLNLAIPGNYEEFMKVVEAFVTQDPDQDGAADTYGIAICNDLDASCLNIMYFLNMFHTEYDMWFEDDGKLVHSAVRPQTKQALAALNEMYTKGWIDPEFGVKDQSAVAMDIANGKIGIVFGVNWAPLNGVLNDAIQADPNADFICVPTNILGVDGEYALTKNNVKCTSMMAISSACEHPEAVIRMMNLFVDLYYESYSDYGITSDGREMWHLAGWPTIQKSTKNMDNMIYGGKYLAGELTADQITGEQLQMALNVKAFNEGDRTMWSYARIFAYDGPNMSSEWHCMDAFDNFDKYSIIDGYLGGDTQGMVDYKSMLDTIRDEAFIKMIIGDMSIDAFDEYTAQWYTAGGQTITDEVNAWYAEQAK